MRRPGLTAIEALLQRERQPYLHIGVRPLSPIIGAEIEGLDLRSEPMPEDVAELRGPIWNTMYWCSATSSLSEADHLRVAGLLGPLVRGGRRAVTAPASDAGGEMEPVMLAQTWRADETYRAAPPGAGVLHIHQAPPLGVGGDMLFANMHLAYELLSRPLQSLLCGLTAVHARLSSEIGGPRAEAAAEHPVIIRHPTTGRPAVFVNREYTSHIVQVEPLYSEAALKVLFRHLETHPVLTCRIRWTPNALVVWDNHSTQHLTLQDFQPRSLAGHVVLIASRPPEAWAPAQLAMMDKDR